jgi:basic membrane protein A
MILRSGSARAVLPWLALVTAAIALVAAARASGKAEARAGTQEFRVGVVGDTRGLADRSFNFWANQGRLRAWRDLKVRTRLFISKSAQDYVPNLTESARESDLTIGVSHLVAEAMNSVAKSYPRRKFAIVDAPWESLRDRPTNVRGLLFREHEAGYLAGFLAGLTIKRRPFRGQQVVGAVGGTRTPPVDRYIAGFRAGARAANPGVRVLVSYVDDATDPAKCKQQALGQIAQGAGAIFQVAGDCGLGALEAAKEQRAWGIGADADQFYLGPHMLTSAVKKMDVAVFETIRAAKAAGTRFRGGSNVVFSVRNGGVGIGKMSPRVPRADRVRLDGIRKQIAAGKIRIPQTV